MRLVTLKLFVRGPLTFLSWRTAKLNVTVFNASPFCVLE